MSRLESLLKLASLIEGEPAANSAVSPLVGRDVIVRSRNAGVIFGRCVSLDGQVVTLHDARQMWSWTAAKGGTVIDCATHGIAKGKLSFPASEPVVVTESCAVCGCTEAASESIRGCESKGAWK